MRIGVVGTGYVGLVTGACFADLGHDVVCIDKDRRKIAALRRGRIPIYEPGLTDIVQRNSANGRLVFSTSVARGVRCSEIIFIAVGTPSRPDGEVDISQVKGVAEEIGQSINGYKIIVNKSTVPVGMSEIVTRIVSRHNKGNHPFQVVSNPEFLREGNAVLDLMSPDRVVIGTDDAQAAREMRELYKSFNTTVLVVGTKSSELIKYASNAFLATKISFINEIANVCEATGADILEVARGIGLDKRIGKAFLSAGIGYGGSCFPKDTSALYHMARKAGYTFRVLKTADEVNQAQRQRVFAKLKSMIGPLRGKRVSLLGLSFKPGTDDLRESPALYLVDKLAKGGARVSVCDPVVGRDKDWCPEPAHGKILKRAVMADNVYSAVKGASAMVLVTDWNEFKELDFPRIKKLMKRPVVIDCRNIYDSMMLAKLGFEYSGIGR